jgi:hypothetical protein
MKHLPARFWSVVWLILPAMLWFASHPASCFASPTNAAPTEPFDYAELKLLTGTVYASGSDQKQLLFKFRRTATRDGTTVHVERRFDLPDGSTGAVETITYESGQLVAYEMKELQAGVWGTIQINPDPKNSARQKMFIKHGHDGEARSKGSGDDLPKDTLIDDTLDPFILAHWDELLRGNSVKFHFISLEWEKAFGFKLTKATESVVDGKPVVVVKMEPTNVLVAGFLNPLYFSFEKDGAHRLLKYVGRTTPRFKKGKAWKYLDAESVFDWK